MSLIEVMIAVILTMIGVLSVVSLQPSGYILATRSDQLGKAAAILREELETQEAWIMNSCNTVATGTSTKTVYSSGPSSAGTGDAPYSVQTTITDITSTGTNIWRVNVRVTNVRVTGPGTNTVINESLVVTRQDYHRQGC